MDTKHNLVEPRDVQATVRLDRDLYERFRALARERDRTVAAQLRRLATQWVATQDSYLDKDAA